jgi:hypothetical protein
MGARSLGFIYLIRARGSCRRVLPRASSPPKERSRLSKSTATERRLRPHGEAPPGATRSAMQPASHPSDFAAIPPAIKRDRSLGAERRGPGARLVRDGVAADGEGPADRTREPQCGEGARRFSDELLKPLADCQNVAFGVLEPRGHGTAPRGDAVLHRDAWQIVFLERDSARF